MSTDINRQPPGIPTGGQFAATAHAEPAVTLDAPKWAAFPHPDDHYDHPMNCWPEGIEEPVSITLGEVDETLPEAQPRGIYPDPQNERNISQPSCTITMANGASLTVVQVGDPEGENTEARYSGDWDHYLNGDEYNKDCVADVAHETMIQAAPA
jgi:hypothetical protein